MRKTHTGKVLADTTTSALPPPDSFSSAPIFPRTLQQQHCLQSGGGELPQKAFHRRPVSVIHVRGKLSRFSLTADPRAPSYTRFRIEPPKKRNKCTRLVYGGGQTSPSTHSMSPPPCSRLRNEYLHGLPLATARTRRSKTGRYHNPPEPGLTSSVASRTLFDGRRLAPSHPLARFSPLRGWRGMVETHKTLIKNYPP